ncbi:hypothetical protein AX17_003791 [Amanita inopinata Kibby_2008]|nr:hypothetical protein AX17_003791 [Amanita inopinata Kibby_2008]
MSNVHDPNAQTGIDMANARRQASINVALVRDFLHDGKREWEARDKVVKVLETDPVFDKSKRDFMTRTERYTRALAITKRVFELQDIHNWTREEVRLAFASLDDALPITLHHIAFEPVFLSQGGPELVNKYGPLITSCGILGCYLQTELAHGSNVNGLETTATYIPDTKEFEIHSPTLTSSKWWIGSLGKTSTHAVVQAKLILPGGKDIGPHLFLVQLRSLDDHRVLPGITTGDIGPKAMGGYTSVDNGYARFDHVRIPKENMLSKFAQVTDDGRYIQPPHAKLSYGGMLYIRANMVTMAGWMMAKAAVASIRYATVRRQGEFGPDGLERQAITYSSVYSRLLPILSHAFVFIKLGKTMTNAFDTMSTRLASGDASSLAEMHAITSGLKVIVSSTAVQDLEVARRSMGGHGYSVFAGLGRLYADYLPSVTYEGDNFVLDKQVTRAALKSHQTLFSQTSPSTDVLSPFSYYLRHLLRPIQATPAISDASWSDSNIPILLLEWRAALIVREYALHLSEPDATVNQRISKAVTDVFVGAQIRSVIESLDLPEKAARVVRKVYLLYLLTTVEVGLIDLLSFGVMRPTLNADVMPSDPTRSLRMAIDKLCVDLLPDAVALTDAFGLTDWELDSALGVYNGKVYEALWKRAQDEPLNQAEVPEAYEESIKPILVRGQKHAEMLRRPKL